MNRKPLIPLAEQLGNESILMNFELAWQNTSEISIVDFLPDENSTRYSEITEELIKIDLEHRLRRGLDSRCFQQYLPEPHNTTDSNAGQHYIQILQFELELRRKLGLSIEITSLSERYPLGMDVIKDLITAASRRTVSISAESTDTTIGMTRTNRAISDGQSIGRFMIKSKIGEGTFSTVYSAVDKILRRPVALKIFHQQYDHQTTQKQRILREAQSAALISHQNVVPVYEAGTCDNLDFIASQLVVGPTLEQRLHSGKLDVSSAVSIAQQVASALSAAHQIGVIHRDLKPANIMLDHGKPVVIDFGLAHLNDASLALTNEGDIVGTPSYMPPEQATGQGWQADPRCDIYSLGAVLYHMVCGRMPFAGTTSQVIHQLIHQSPLAPSKINSDIPSDLETIILKCLEKDLGDRYQNAEELERDLLNVQQGIPIIASPVGRTKRIIRWTIQHPAISGVAALALLLATFLLGTLTQLNEVKNQRDLAIKAEAQKQLLLAESAGQAGFAELKRGQFQDALHSFKNYQALSNLGTSNDIAHIGLSSAYLGLRTDRQALAHFNQIETGNKNPEYLLLKAELAGRGLLASASTIDVFQLALTCKDLPHADRLYAKGMLAEQSEQAAEYFKTAIQWEANHYQAYRMLTLMQFSLARFDELDDQLQIAKQLFPRDVDFQLLDALRLAGQGKLEEANKATKSANLSRSAEAQWLGFNDFVFSVVNDMPYDSGLAEFDAEKLVQLGKDFKQSIQPLLIERGWRFPPRIARQFAVLPSQIVKSDHANSLESIELLQKLVSTHPEASLQNLLAGFHIEMSFRDDINKAEAIGHLVNANQLFQEAASSPSFINEGNLFSWKGVFATSVSLVITHQHEVERYRNVGAEASTHLDPTDMAARHVAVFSKVLINFQRPKLAERWIVAWTQQPEATEEDQVAALWYLAICQRDLQQWLACLETTQLLLELSPDHEAAIGLQNGMAEELRKTMSNNSKNRP